MIDQNDKLLIQTIKGTNKGKIPIWLMRQAGRYLPEYQSLRAQAGDFLSLCYNPNWAKEITLQPLRRFNLDAAIIFSDILVVPHALGLKVEFKAGEGPVIEQVTDIKQLNINNLTKFLEPGYEAISLVREELDSSKALIGFAGSPWTVASYMIEGKGSKDFAQIKKLAFAEDPLLDDIINILTESTIEHLSNQIRAGADLVQLFDSWAGVLPKELFEKYVIAPTKHIVKELKLRYPDVCITGFPRCAGNNYEAYVLETKVDVVGIDSFIDYGYVKDKLRNHTVIQGNLDPAALLSDKKTLAKWTLKVLNGLADEPFIFNLGHGVVKTTQIENIEFLVNMVKSYESSNIDEFRRTCELAGC